MKPTTGIAIAALLLLGTTAGLVAGRALATGAPQQTPLTYGGTVTDKDGKPYPTAQPVSLAFYDKPDATVAKCTAPTVQAEAGTGHFAVVLPPECAQAVHDAPDLWTEATVGAAKTVLPRTHVGAVPYALEADVAKVAMGAGGGLKAAVDGVVADVAGLKTKPADGGGPWVVDAKGLKVGRLLSLEDPLVGQDSSSLQWLYQDRFVVLTASGHILTVGIDGVMSVPMGGAGAIFYAEANCTGELYLAFKPQVVRMNRRVYPSSGELFIFAGNPAGATKPDTISYKSFKQAGKCTANPMATMLVKAQAVSSAELGIPSILTPPLTIQP